MEDRHRGLVKWYDRGLQNLWWEFDSLVPCFREAQKCLMHGISEHFFYDIAQYPWTAWTRLRGSMAVHEIC